MTDYTEKPELEVQHAIIAAHQAGATSATVTMSREHVQVEDNRNGDDAPAHQVTCDVQIHPSRYRHEFHQNVTEHIAPEGVVVTIKRRQRHHQESAVTLRNVHDLVHASHHLDDLNCEIYITGDHNIPGLTIVNSDGSSTRHNFHNYHGMGSLHYHPPFAHTDTPLKELGLSAVVVVDPGHQPPKPDDLYAPAIALARDFVFQHSYFTANSNPPGISWASQHLKHVYELLHHSQDGNPHTWPAEPSTCEYRLPGQPSWQKFLTPANAVAADFDQVQAPALRRALKHGDTPDFIVVRTSDPNVAVLRLVHTNIENLDGSISHYPARSPDQDNQTENYDGYLLAQGEHIPTTRVERVNRITVTFEVQSPTADTPPQRFNVETDVYVDQDFHNDLLLVTTDSPTTNHQLRNMVGLYEIDTSHLTTKQTTALHDYVRDWTTEYLVDQLHSGSQHALHNILDRAASAIEAVIAAHQVTVNEQSFTTPSGTVTITLTTSPHQEDNTG